MENLVPHGVCLSSVPEIIAALVFGNFLTFVAYLAIPIALWRLFTVLRGRLPNVIRRLLPWGAAFVLLCGLTHAVNDITMYNGGWWYAVEAVVVITTAMVSLTFLALTWGAMPEILRLVEEKRV